MFKKINLALALAFAAFVIGCGGEKKEGEGNGTDTTGTSGGTSTTTTTTTVTTGTASVSGSVTFEGTAPKAVPISMKADKDCAAQHKTTVNAENIVVNSNSTLKNVFVFVKNAPKGNYAAPTTSATIDQKGCMYNPHATAMMVGQKIEITNSDPLLHNIHSQPKVNKEFNNGQPNGAPKIEHTFDQEESTPFAVKCDVHAWMSAYIGVYSHPFFAVTGDDGKFEIKGLPAGTYTIVAWQEKLGTQETSVTVKDGEGVTQNVTFKKAS